MDGQQTNRPGPVPLSIIICTYNRAPLLAQALQSLVEQTAPANMYEVLVIDNNSSDTTKEVALSFAHKLPLRYVFEQKQGLSHARNAGVAHARGTYLGFIDDDSRARADWIEVALRVSAEQHPDIFGGPYLPWYDSPKPNWFKDSYEIRKKFDHALYLPPDKGLSGSNIFFKRETFNVTGLFDPRLGMSGTRIGLGEEMQLQVIANAHGLTRYYTPELVIHNLVLPEKMTLGYIFRRRLAGGYMDNLVSPEQQRSTGKDFLIAVWATLVIGLNILKMPFRNRHECPHWQQYFAEYCLVYTRYWTRFISHFYRP
jgi:glucosyl-dolichyl phosphate glucuronosyltransferase